MCVLIRMQWIGNITVIHPWGACGAKLMSSYRFSLRFMKFIVYIHIHTSAHSDRKRAIDSLFCVTNSFFVVCSLSLFPRSVFPDRVQECRLRKLRAVSSGLAQTAAAAAAKIKRVSSSLCMWNGSALPGPSEISERTKNWDRAAPERACALARSTGR